MSGLVQSRALVTSNVSTSNSSTVPLAAGASFAGAWVPAGGYTTILATCYCDQPGQVAVSWSADRTNADLVQSYQVAANTFFSQRLPVSGVYVKTSYTNGPAAAQTAFRLTSILTTANDGAEVSVNLTNGDVVTVQGVDGANVPRTLSTTANGTVNTRDSVISDCVDFGSNSVQVSVVADSVHAQNTATSTASISAQLPPSLGPQAASSSLSVVGPTGGALPVADAAAGSLLTDLVQQGTNLQTIADGIGDVNTTLLARLNIGGQASGSSLAVVPSVDGFVVSAKNTSNEPVQLAADDNGRLLVSIAADSTHGQATAASTASISAQLPAALGAQAAGASLSVVQAASSTFAVSLAADAATVAPDGNGVKFAGYSLEETEFVSVAVNANGHVKTQEQRLPATLGPAGKSGSLSIAPATDANFATTDTNINAAVDVANSGAIKVSIVADSSTHATSTASVASQLPAALGAQAAAASLSVVQCYDEAFNVGSAQLPSALGLQAAANSLSVIQATDRGVPGAGVFEVTRSLVPGARVIDRHIDVSSRAQATLTFVDAAGGSIESDPFPYPRGGATSTVWLSSDSIDDYAGGVGARSVTLTYVDGTGVEASTVVTLNGTTPVSFTPSPSAFIPYIQDLTVKTWGSNGGLSGTITIQTDNAGTPNEVLGIYTSGAFQSSSFYVQPGRVALVTAAKASAGGVTMDLLLKQVKGLPGASTIVTTRWHGKASTSTGWADVTLSRPVPFVGPCLIFWQYNRGATAGNDLSFQLVEYTL